MSIRNSQEWILLIHQLPPKPTNLRVRTWRKLQALGAVAIKNSVYVLPYNEKTNEDFQWLKQEIETSGGEANLFRAETVEGASDKEIVKIFRDDRNESYKTLIAEFEGLSGAAGEQMKRNSLSAGKLAQYGAELGRLRQELERVTATDFFQASLGAKAFAAFEKCRRVLRSTERKRGAASSDDTAGAQLKISDHQNRRWVTRKNPHIDRLASGWLIRRFIDKRPRFQFISEGTTFENAISFDMADGDFTHRGEDCTFETMIKGFGLDADSALSEIAEIVHDIDLKDKKFNRTEVSGVDAVVRGLSEVYADDGERLKQSMHVFDALYELFGQRKAPAYKRGRSEKRRSGISK